MNNKTSVYTIFSSTLRSLALCLVVLLMMLQQAWASRAPSSNRECAVCHIMWLTEFKKDTVETLVPYDPKPMSEHGREDVASTSEMCFSCHDGFVLDSRDLWKNRHNDHPVGMKPSDKVKIPKSQGKDIFPLNEEGKVYCGTCHSAHGVDWSQKDSSIFMRIPNTKSELCMACHIKNKGGPKQGNHPVMKKLDKRPNFADNTHAQFSKDNEIICQTCHQSHSAPEKHLLVTKNNKSQLCGTCHENKNIVKTSKHNLAIMSSETENVKGQIPREAGPCSACHIAHYSTGPRLWARKDHSNLDPVSNFCLDCHNPKGPAKDKGIGKHSHPVNMEAKRVGVIAEKQAWRHMADKSESTNGLEKMKPLPLFDSQGHRVSSGGNVTCLSCHDPHVWSPTAAHDKPTDPRQTEGDGNTSFLRIKNDNKNTLCLNCHRREAMVLQSKHFLDISVPTAKNESGKTTKQAGPCSACHIPHNATGDHLWARSLKYTEGSGTEKLCTSCHRKDGIAKEKITGKHSHPMEVRPKSMTSDLPMFTEAKLDSKHGKMDCATCHNPHQWDPDNMWSKAGANSKVEGDASNSFLRMTANNNAKLCTNCHKDKKSVIGTDHDMRVTAPKAVNGNNETVAQSGPCGQCHAVHNANTEHALWSLNPVEAGQDSPESLCRSCHQPKGTAAEKVPEIFTHPKRTIAVNFGRSPGSETDPQNPPMVDKDGQLASVGFISCPTCHNPHKWDAKSDAGGPNKNIEGNVFNSFLHNSSSEKFICANCHGQDSLYRYKFFHWKRAREGIQGKP